MCDCNPSESVGRRIYNVSYEYFREIVPMTYSIETRIEDVALLLKVKEYDVIKFIEDGVECFSEKQIRVALCNKGIITNK